MFIFSPQYWLFEGLLLFVIFWLLFSFFLRNRTGRKIARELSMKDCPEAAELDVEAAQEAASEQLPEAIRQSKEASQRASRLNQALGLDQDANSAKPEKK